jgi:hypothetical protein
MGLNLSFAEDANYFQIANCKDLKKRTSALSVWNGPAEPPDELKPYVRVDLARMSDGVVHRHLRWTETRRPADSRGETLCGNAYARKGSGPTKPGFQAEEVWMGPAHRVTCPECAKRNLLTGALTFKSSREGAVEKPYYVIDIDSMDDPELVMLAESIAPVINEDDDPPDDEPRSVRQSAWWSAEVRSWEEGQNIRSNVCQPCPLCPDSNFENCYPRMGSYSYVAALAEYVQSRLTDRPIEDGNGSGGSSVWNKLAKNPFVIGTAPGGFRIGGPEEESAEEREARYKQMLEAIARVRETLEASPQPAAILEIDGVADRSHFYPASPANGMFGLDTFISGGDYSWGVHYGRGIAYVTGRSRRNPFAVKPSNEKEFAEQVNEGIAFGLLDKYIKIQSLFDRAATDGERAAAKKAIDRMEKKNPELRSAEIVVSIDGQQVRYYKRIEKRGDEVWALGVTGRWGKLDVECPLLHDSWSNANYSAIEMGSVSALTQFGHLLDTAETAIKLALEYGLTVFEC